MAVVTAVRDYVNRMLQDISGMKVLILDSDTVSIVSVVYSQSDLLKKEVFLVELLDSTSMSKEPMSHLKAVYFLRPTSENIQQMRRQLAKPRFGEYHLFFSNILRDTQIHILADSDEHEVVQQLQTLLQLTPTISLLIWHQTICTCFRQLLIHLVCNVFVIERLMDLLLFFFL
nr:vacuolar protein sorting-associated protein 45 homolog [Ipomoea batatas]GMC75430.1 vacuolar protein sorting-associated protein 45 homolog [Ipomoea batatas]GMD07631.1 vacuolar protein sorting-associated protein 45 homolog [Ipomoea batatas]